MEEIKKLTLEDVVNKYGDCKVKFSSYYKYNFTFKGKFGDLVILARYGGDSGDIYKFDVDVDREEIIKYLDANWITISKDNKVIEEYYDNY